MASASLELLADSSQIRTATRDLDRLNATGSQTERAQSGINKATKQTSSSMAGLSKNFGQAGIQVQQFAGQIQGGQSALLALSQQGADLGIVLGQAGLGAAVGLSATALALLISSAGDAESALDDLEKIADTVGKTLEQAADGSDVFSESIQRLATRSEALARVQIAQTISELEGQISTSAQGIRSAIDDFSSIGLRDFNQIALESGLTMEELAVKAEELSGAVTSNLNGSSLIKYADAVDFVSRKFELTTGQAIGLASAISEFQNDQGPVGIARLRNEIESLEGELGAGNAKFNQFAAALLPFFDATRTGVDRINLLRQALADLSGTIDDNSELSEQGAKRSRDYSIALQTQIIALQNGAQAAEVYALEQRAVIDGTEEELPKLISLVNQKYELKRAQEEAAEAARQEAQAQREYNQVLDQIFRNQERKEAQAVREQERQLQSFESLKQQIALQESQILLDNEQYELRRNLLALGEGASQDQITEITALTEQMQALRFESELLGPTLENSLQNVGLNALDSLSQGLANAITEGESLRDVIGGIANSILNELLTAVIRYAVGSAAQALIGQTTATTAAVASGTAIAAAYTPAAIAANIATLGGAATLAAGTAATAIPTMASLISASSIAGFESGGYTGNYGTKQIAGVVHGQEFVMNAAATRRNRGALEAMNNGQSVGGDTYVNVTNNATNSEVSTQERTDAQGNRVIDIVVANIQQRGRIHKAMTQTTTAGNRI